MNGSTVVNAYRALLLLAIGVIGYFLASLHSDLRDTSDRLREVEGKVIGIERDIEYLKYELQARNRPGGSR